MPTVSVIVRTHNRPLLLRRALTSICEQSFLPCQVVIVDTGSEPSIVLQDIFPGETPIPIDVLRVAVEISLAEALNRGIECASGTHIAILDDDDTWERDFLQTHMRFLAAHSGCQGSASLTRLILEEISPDNIISTLSSRPFNRRIGTHWLSLFNHNQFTINAFVYERACAKKLGFYRPEFPVLEDWDFNIRFSAEFRIGAIHEYHSNYHKRVVSGTVDRGDNTRLSDHLAVGRSIRRFLTTDTRFSFWQRQSARFFAFTTLCKRSLSDFLKRHPGSEWQ